MDYTRRDFLKATLGASTLLSFASTAPPFLVKSVMGAATQRNERAFCADVPLRELVPYEDDEYGRNRPTLRLPTKKLHKIGSAMGFHPRMAAFARLYKDGFLSIIQGVGNPNPDRSHEVAMRIWHTADPDRLNRQTGWLGRAADSVWNQNKTNTPAVFVGSYALPFALNAENAVVPSIRSLGDLTTGQMPGYPKGQSQLKRTSELTRKDKGNPLLDFLQHCTLNTYTNSRRIEAVTRASANTTEYPSFQLAATFRTVARLIRADVGIRIFFIEFGGGGIGGFDNHANQLGNHCALLHQLSESLAAFVHDLKRDKLLGRVLLMTFSEFGRTLKENGRRGTGHGAAAPVFLAGGKLKGDLIGPRPSLTDLDNGAPKFHTDFRRVYATVLDKWLGFDSRTVLGRQFESLDVLNV